MRFPCRVGQESNARIDRYESLADLGDTYARNPLKRARHTTHHPQPDRGDEVNSLFQHLRREFFSEAEFGD
jgi:hypothetical protein